MPVVGMRKAAVAAEITDSITRSTGTDPNYRGAPPLPPRCPLGARNADESYRERSSRSVGSTAIAAVGTSICSERPSRHAMMA